MVTSDGPGRRAVLLGVFGNDGDAQRCVEELRRAGFRDDQLGVMARGTGPADNITSQDDSGSAIAAGTATGAVAGAGVGALWALGMVAGAVPVVGPVVVGGLLATVLASAATGAVAGSIVGALVGLGVPEEEAAHFERELHAGRVLVTVRPDDRTDLAQSILTQHGAQDLHATTAAETVIHHVAGTATTANPRPTAISSTDESGAGPT